MSNDRAQQTAALDGTVRVRAGRDLYLTENGFTVEAYDAKWTPASLFGLTFKLPNTPTHRRAIMWHDLHHVATGYGTDLAGEAEISAWELRRGLAGLDLYVSAIVVTLAISGLAIAPARTWRAWQAAGQPGGNLFARALSDYDATLDIDVAELRRQLGVPPEGLARVRGLHSTAPDGMAAAGVEPGGASGSSRRVLTRPDMRMAPHAKRKAPPFVASSKAACLPARTQQAGLCMHRRSC